MGWTAAAIIGSAVVGAVSSSKAASAQKSAAAGAGAISERQYQQTREDLAPWRQIGGQAIGELGALYGLGENAMAQAGRGGDTQVAHVTPGETVVPEAVAARLPGGRNALARAFKRDGADPSQYTVGSPRNRMNPYTGAREFKYGADTREGGASGFGRGNPRDTDQGQDPNQRNRIFRNNQPSYGFPTPPPNATASLPDDYYSQENAMARFYESPDYNINFDEGAKTIERSAAARGGLFSGNTGTALVRYGQDYGNRLYNQYANRLSSFAGFGQTAATNTGQFGASSAANQGNAMMAGGNAAAQGWYGLANSANAAIGNALYYNQVR